jgi:crotonobetainyl-CoA:carnitine CoA-transferase CaiB-like acyl-CoA transferase
MTAHGPKHVLDGYKVLDFTQFVAGPTATLMMAEMGAEVVKVEIAPNGDPTRYWPILKDRRSGYFVQHNLGKQSICVDVKNPEGLGLVKQLIPKFDVLVENFAPGVIGRIGLDYETVRALNPRIVMCSVSSFGQEGPLAHEPGFDWCGAAYAGIPHMTGFADGPPMIPMMAIGDVNTGVHALGAIACALLYRERTGHGQYLDISLLDTYFHCHEAGVQMYSLTGGEFKPKRSGLHAYYISPAGFFKAKEGYVVIFAQLDHLFAKLCDAMGRPELVRDPRFVTNTDRVAHQKELVDIIEGWFATMPSDEAAIEALKARSIPVAPVLSVEQAINHPHLRQRGTIRKVHDRVLGDFDLPGYGFKFSEFPTGVGEEAPMLGEHNGEILGKYLGQTPERIKELESRGILHSGSF